MSFCTLTLAYVCVSWGFDCLPNFTKNNPLVIDLNLEIESFTALNSFAGVIKTKKTYGSSISIPVSGSGKLIATYHSYKSYATVFT